MVIDFEYQVIRWDDVSIPMNRTKLAKNEGKEFHAIFQLATKPKTVQQATEQVLRILDASYEKANLVEVVKNTVVIYRQTGVAKSLIYYGSMRIYLMVPWGSSTQTQYI